MSTGLDNRPTTVTEMGSQMDAGRHDLACSRPPLARSGPWKNLELFFPDRGSMPKSAAHLATIPGLRMI